MAVRLVCRAPACSGRTQRAAARKDPVLTKKPEVGSAGPKKRDKIKTTSFAQFIRKSKLDNKHLGTLR